MPTDHNSPHALAAHPRDRVNIQEEQDVTYWTRELGVTAEQLRRAVEAVGPSPEKLRGRLRKLSFD